MGDDAGSVKSAEVVASVSTVGNAISARSAEEVVSVRRVERGPMQ